MDNFNKITDLARYVEEAIENNRGFQREVKSSSEPPIWMMSDNQSLAENKILLEALKLFMKKIYAQDHTKCESKAFFNQLICQAFYNAKLYTGDALVGEKLLKDIIDA